MEKNRNLVLHMGCHRTGTTSLQRFLQNNKRILLDQGVQILIPPETRKTRITLSGIPDGKVVVSEENTLGTMEGNYSALAIYPNLKTNLSKYHDIIVKQM